MSPYYDKNGRRITKAQFCLMIQDPSYASVAKTLLLNGYTVLSIWLGFPMRADEVPPRIFETVVLPPNNSKKLRAIVTFASATEEEALKYHKDQVDLWSTQPKRVPDVSQLHRKVHQEEGRSDRQAPGGGEPPPKAG